MLLFSHGRPAFGASIALIAGALTLLTAPSHAQVTYNFATGDQGFTSNSPLWSYSAAGGVGGTGAWNLGTQLTVANPILTSPIFTVTTPGTVTGSLFHRFNFEARDVLNYDGGLLEYSVNGGDWQQIGNTLLTGTGYTGTLSNNYSNPLAGRQAFSNLSTGYATPVYTTTGFTLGTSSALNFAAGSQVQFRFNAGFDNSDNSGNPSWQLGSVSFTNAAAPSAAAPEPGTFALLAVSGIPALGIALRRRKK